MFWKGFQLFGTPWTVAHQTTLSMGVLRQEYWSGLPFPSPGNLPDPGIEPRSLTLRADSLPSEPPLKPTKVKWALRVEHSSNRFSVFMKQNIREFSLCLCVFSSISLPHRPPCVRTNREASLGGKSSDQNLSLLAPWSGTSSLQNGEEINLLLIPLSLLYSFMAFFFFNILFIYFWLCWVSIAALL